jgi:hypothetical protein
MNIQNFNKKLSKIVALADNGSIEGHISALERDLLLSYIRELYDIVLDGNVVAHKHVSHADIQPKKEELRQTEAVKAESTPQVSEPKHPLPAVEESLTKSTETVVSPSAEVEIAVNQPTKAPVTPPDAKKSEKLAELFADDKIADLSDRLASSQIKDLTKAMGINERIFTQQELFGNNQQKFNDTLQKLNNCQSFDDAKQYLTDDVIFQMDWLNETRLKKASTFVKLVKRKFV